MYRILAILALTACTCSLVAQSTILWKGGTPGRETAWNEPRNWNKHRVPNDLDKVIIRVENNGHFSMPIIINSAIVGWLEIQAGASLTIAESGQLTVDGRYTYSEGITLSGGMLNAEGNVILVGIEEEVFTDQYPTPLVYTPGYHLEVLDNRYLLVNSR